jgi:hypothetical protein
MMDFVFTVCDDAAGETCPVWSGQPMTAHWGVPDPARATGTEAEIGVAFADAFRMLNNRISVFTTLPIAKLDRLSLQARPCWWSSSRSSPRSRARISIR